MDKPLEKDDREFVELLAGHAVSDDPEAPQTPSDLRYQVVQLRDLCNELLGHGRSS